MKTIRMKKADWQAWDTALRSGSYAQGGGWLHNRETGTYCCLGVLQHCLTGATEDDDVPNHVPSLSWLEAHGITFRGIGFCQTSVPSLPLLRKNAAEANDDGVSFVEIADAIAEAVEFTDE